ncbi:MAG: hypothetical protein F2754_06985, partial [Actinobacteria bacterium]|nr:hypothetical protein [Actinomycetota bacterium]
MRYERLVIEGGGASYVLDFHPRLTVISGVGQIERDGIVNELVGALGATRAGVHAEIVADGGHQFAIFRPVNAHHRVISVDTACDVSDRFRNSAGEIDILARAGLNPRSARQLVRLGAAELRASGQGDQSELWARAARAIDADNDLRIVADDTGAQPEDAAIVQAVEDHHNAFVAEQRRAERTRRITFGAAAFLALFGLAMAMRQSEMAAGLLIIVASAVAAMSLRHNGRLEGAEAAETAALEAAGAQSYLGFHLQRVDGLLSDDRQRRRLMHAADIAKQARQSFATMVGLDIEPSWAVDHRGDVEARRAGHRGEISGRESSHAKLLRGRLEGLRSSAAGGESLPMVLDDSFREIAREDRPALLELLVERSREQQIIFLTDDEDIATWARLESLAGDMAIVEPVA